MSLPLILNEFNAVQSGNLPKDNGYDTYFGIIPANGGPWLEFVITEDRIGLNQWKMVAVQDNYVEQRITLPPKNIVDLTNLRKGTILTISSVASTHVSSFHGVTEYTTNDAMFKPEEGVLWVNISISDLTITDSQGNVLNTLVVSNLGFKIKVLDNNGVERVPYTGEGVYPPYGIDAFEVFKLKANPSPNVPPNSHNYGDDNDGKVLSTFGSPNQWLNINGHFTVQDFTILQFGKGTPYLQQVKSYSTSPFMNSKVATADGEGITFVEPNNALWIVDDNYCAIYEMDRSTGAFISLIPQEELEETPIYNGTQKAGYARVTYLEGICYDRFTDKLYVMSGRDGTPTMLRLKRPDTSHIFSIDAWQPLEIFGLSFYGTDVGVAANGALYFTDGTALFRYDFSTNTILETVHLTLTASDEWIYGMYFSPDGKTLWVVTSKQFLHKVDWTSQTKGILQSFDMEYFGVRDPRGVTIIDNQIHVIDGFDFYINAANKYAIHVYEIKK